MTQNNTNTGATEPRPSDAVIERLEEFLADPDAVIDFVVVPNKGEPITLAFLLESLRRQWRAEFEGWAFDFWINSTSAYERARRELRTLESLGASDLAATRERLRVWGAQVHTAQVLAGAHRDEPELDYTDPVVLKYFALWLWATNAGTLDFADELPTTGGPILWRDVLASDFHD